VTGYPIDFNAQVFPCPWTLDPHRPPVGSTSPGQSGFTLAELRGLILWAQALRVADQLDSPCACRGIPYLDRSARNDKSALAIVREALPKSPAIGVLPWCKQTAVIEGK
jgi:hypothetical protein